MATCRVAAVFLEDNELVGWSRSVKAFQSEEKAERLVREWIKGFAPDILIIEGKECAERKGQQSRWITECIASVFDDAEPVNVRVKRPCKADNKYEEAQQLTQVFPSAATLLPERPPIWLPEPKNMSYFEALSLVRETIT